MNTLATVAGLAGDDRLTTASLRPVESSSREVAPFHRTGTTLPGTLA